MPRSVVIDFETASTADLPKVGAWRYAEDPSTFVLCLGYKLLDGDVHAPTRVLTEREVAFTARGHEELLALVNDPSVIFIAHNAGFEQAIWKHVMVGVHGWPPLPPERWHDTMAVAYRKTLPPALDNLGAILKLPVQKDKDGHRLMMQMCKPGRDGNFDHPPEKLARLVQYNVGDVDSQYHVHLKIGGLGPEERRVWLLDQKINQRGIRVDVDYVRQCMGLLEAARGPMEEEFVRITGVKPTQRAKVLEWIQGQGVKMFDLRKGTLDAFLDPDNPLDDFDDLSPAVLKVIQLRRILASSSVSKLGRMIETMNFDGRVRGTMQYHGARTGRNAGRLVQPLNMPRPTVLSDNLTQGAVMAMIRAGDLDAINEACGNAFDAVISTLRGCFAPAKGRKFAAGDFNAIEARVVLALAGEYERAESFDKGDAYCDMAATIYGRKVTKADKDERQMGKTVVLGCGFQMSAAKFALVTGLSETFAEKAVTAYRKEWAPLVPKLWYGLEQVSTEAVWCNDRRAYQYRGISYQMRGEYLVCTLPSGREIYYFEPRREQKTAPWDPEKILPAWSFLSFTGKRIQRKMMFGGLATENVVQATARDIMVEAMFRCEERGLPLVFTVYDEIVAEPEEGMRDAAKVLQECMEERSEWVQRFRIPIRAECEEMTEYRK